MEDRKITEQESFELISQMIQNTRRNLDAGSGNIFLLWGYIGTIATLVVYGGLCLRKTLIGCGAFGEYLLLESLWEYI